MTIMIERMTHKDLIAEREAIAAQVGDLSKFDEKARRNDLTAPEREIHDRLSSNRYLLGE